jgi:hypothetical protein
MKINEKQYYHPAHITPYLGRPYAFTCDISVILNYIIMYGETELFTLKTLFYGETYMLHGWESTGGLIDTLEEHRLITVKRDPNQNNHILNIRPKSEWLNEEQIKENRKIKIQEE